MDTRKYTLVVYHSAGRCNALGVLRNLRSVTVLSIRPQKKDRSSHIEIQTYITVAAIIDELSAAGCRHGDVVIYDIRGGTFHDMPEAKSNAAE